MKLTLLRFCPIPLTRTSVFSASLFNKLYGNVPVIDLNLFILLTEIA